MVEFKGDTWITFAVGTLKLETLTLIHQNKKMNGLYRYLPLAFHHQLQLNHLGCHDHCSDAPFVIAGQSTDSHQPFLPIKWGGMW